MSATSIRHSTRMVVRARELRAAGWTVTQTRRLLDSEFGVMPSADSVSRWTDQAYAARRNARIRDLNHRRLAPTWNFRLGGTVSREYQAAFARRLIGEHVPIASVAKVMTLVFGACWTRDSLLTLLEETA